MIRSWVTKLRIKLCKNFSLTLRSLENVLFAIADLILGRDPANATVVQGSFSSSFPTQRLDKDSIDVFSFMLANTSTRDRWSLRSQIAWEMPSNPTGRQFTLLLLLFAGTIFCEFLRFGKNRKIKYPQKFLPTYQAPWYNHYLRDDFPFRIRHNLSLLIIFAFPFFLPVPSRARKNDVWWYRWWCEFLEWNFNFILRSTG